MMGEKRNVPELRFDGFEKYWVVKNLGEEIQIFNGYAFPSKLSQNNGSRWVKIADVGINKILNSNKSYLPPSFTNKYKKFVLQEGDVVVALTRPILAGKLKIAKIDHDSKNSLLNQRVGKLISLGSLDYAYQLFQRRSLIGRIENNIAGTDPPNLSPNDLSTFRLLFPSLPEQQKIASFLTAVDRRIELLAQKKEKLERYKKGVMQQIFAQNLRFKQEDGSDFPDWEEKKLGEVAKFSKGKGISKVDISAEGNLECIRYGELYTEYAEVIDEVKSRTKIDKKTLVLSQANDVIIPSSGETQLDIARAACVLRSGVALGGDLNIIRSSLNGVFLSFYLNHRRKYQIAQMAQGISVVHLYNSQLENLNIEIPSLEEQEKIVRYLVSLDNSIENLKKQINHTQTWKKGLLQKMFV
ncbi:restriction endonuclease subunit S [Algoriphagus sp. AGSA1]|uniref:restriction endonuclease subunit S n=1 Tax=Algoriphagus sp. AGSA1 TaxID=2907213 RepID=UPI001F41ED3F|nr:restriction endonuclease subunit S [Algoriphagus sp. AGSA1]MCE7058121.1 restriction endonuclease subunit S [Algoriphagus sp. AGSA1]